MELDIRKSTMFLMLKGKLIATNGNQLLDN